jgi:hypothetical protein
MAIHEHLTRIPKREPQQIGWTKARELVKVARAERQRFDCAPWVHKASGMPREEFKREVERHLTGRETEPHEILYFKAYKSQLPVIEETLETAALMLGSDKSRGYCLEMICADFLAGANLEGGNPDALILSLHRLYRLMPHAKQHEFLEKMAALPLPNGIQPGKQRIERSEVIPWGQVFSGKAGWKREIGQSSQRNA